MSEELTDNECVSKWVSHEMNKNKEMNRDQAVAIAYSKCGLSRKDNTAWNVEDINMIGVDSLNNVIKVPVILAREMVQSYEHGKSKHFKPYDELVKAIDNIEDLPVIIEHKQWGEDDVIGHVKEFRADDKSRSIKGVAYITESKLLPALANTLKKGLTIPVSIGFWADLDEGGVFDGVAYDKTQRDIVLNHLAICINSIARCPPNQCGLNLDTFEMDSIDGDRLINKGNHYYYIKTKILNEKEENEQNTKNQEIGDNMGDIRNFPKGVYTTPPNENPKASAPSRQIEMVGDDIKAVLSTLLDWCQYFPAGQGREDAESLLQSLLGDNKMGDNEEITKLESRINILKDSIKEKDTLISKYEDEKKVALIDSITKFSVFKKDDLDGKCVAELAIINDTVSKFDPSMAKAVVLPKPKQTKETIEDARMSPLVFSKEPFKEDE